MRYPVSSFILETFPGLSRDLYGLPAWYWVSLIAALFVAFLVAGFLKQPLSSLLAFSFRQKENSDKSLFIDNLKGPISFLTALMIFLVLSSFIKEPRPEEAHAMSVAIKVALFVILTYLAYGLIDLSFSRLIRREVGPRSKISLVLPLGRRVSKTLLIFLACLLLLAQFGVDVSAFLVGLGVGGLAIALAAKNILENLFGGAVLSLDQPFQVGDYCKCGDIVGYVEEIGIRSTRIRTLDRTLIIIPNSKLSEMHIENYMEREKIRLYITLRLELTTPLSRIRELLKATEELLLENQEFYHDSYRIRLIGVSDLGYQVELLAFARTTDFGDFVAIRERFLFKVLEKMQNLSVAIAVPTHAALNKTINNSH